MKNNKGVTLVELLIVIVVMGIIAAFAVPAVGNIIENSNKDKVVSDALQIEEGVRLYCIEIGGCAEDQDIYWEDVEDYVDGIDAADYTNAGACAVVGACVTTGADDDVVVAQYNATGTLVVLIGASGSYSYADAASGGNPNFTTDGKVPSDLSSKANRAEVVAIP